jgi:hypothetical protein
MGLTRLARRPFGVSEPENVSPAAAVTTQVPRETACPQPVEFS